MCENTSGISNNTIFDENNGMKSIKRTVARASFNVGFRDLNFSVKDKSSKEGWRQILHSISGKFLPGEFSAILGPSGSGKTSLLNALAGYVTLGVEGDITMNGRARSDLDKVSTYIMGENTIQPYLTVKEAMMYAANFKLGPDFNNKDKNLMVDEVISFLGMKDCSNTFSDKLSGGERKRLTIALELIGNSPILFLDEPTTGLDDFTVKQCVDLLQKISRLGKTVICTIHQPSASLFQLFDQVYIVANGFCVYNGSPTELVPFLSTVGFSCPSTHTPADFIIELVDLDPSTIDNLKEAIQNGKINIIEPKEHIDSTDLNDTIVEPRFSVQFSSLLSRMFLQIRRNRIVLFIQLFYFLFAGISFGVLWGGMGNKAEYAINVFKCLNCSVMVLVYKYLYIPVLLYPIEFELMKREYFNGWYTLEAYYLALTLSTLPLLVFFSTMFLIIVYLTTDQPMEMDRFFGFCLIGLLEAFTTQGLGYLIGTLFDNLKGSIITTFLMIPTYVISFYGFDYNQRISEFMRFLMDINFIRHGIAGVCNAVFYDRERLTCDEIYCHFEYPKTLLNFLSIVPRHYSYSAVCLVIYSVVARIAVYFCLKCRLSSDFRSKFVKNFRKLCKC